jgi:hypothetical protein
MPGTILKKLKELKRILPDTEYSRTSLVAIIHDYPQRPLGVFGTLFFRIGLTGAVLAVIVFGTIKSEAPLKLAGLDSSGLQAEAQELDLQLRLTEVSAAESQPTATALSEAAQNGPGHLNTLIIKKEAPKLNLEEYVNPEVDAALKALNE